MLRRSASNLAKIAPDAIRARFAAAMSAMYQQEVPLYANLTQLVTDVNNEYLAKNPTVKAQLAESQELARLDLERHGAIRIGKAEELFNMRRVFNVMGMQPVAYYDLAPAGVPVHSTAFRAVTRDAMAVSPFRVFCSLLRLELIQDEQLRKRAEDILAKREIFSPEALRLTALFEAQGGQLEEADADTFVKEALETFRWHSQSTVTAEEYDALSNQHRLIADIVAFKGPHINHLTPRTLDIDTVQAMMPQRGMDAKLSVEGPPLRKCPILLRQTSFKALNEDIKFTSGKGKHSARFGEIEQRGVALTPKGRLLYDKLLEEVRVKIGGAPTESNLETYYLELRKIFSQFPDTETELHDQGLAFYHYHPTAAGIAAAPLANGASVPLKELIEKKYVRLDPITYEDFLPASAAGIFQSNLGDAAREEGYTGRSNQQAFEKDLGQKVLSEMTLYAADSDASLKTAFKALGQQQ